MENRDSVNQRRRTVERFVAEHCALLARHGSLMATWRTRGGKRTGPYYSLVVRDAQGQRRFVYLGADQLLVAEVRATLATLQAPKRQRHASHQAQRALRRGLRAVQQELDRHLATAGLWRKGCEVRGWRGGEAGRIGRAAREPR